jgi:hypothetical protein
MVRIEILGHTREPVDNCRRRLFPNYLRSLCKIDRFSCSDCRIVDTYDGQKAYSQTGKHGPLSDLWRGAGREVRTQYRTAP